MMGDNYQKTKKYSSDRQGGYSNENQAADPKYIFERSDFKAEWITNEADALLPEFADKMGKYMADNKLTNSKIRSIYGEIKRIQMGEFEKEKASFYLLKPKVAYALGRDNKNKGLQLFKFIFDRSAKDVSDQKTYHNFCNLLEAILAYHKANGGD